VKVTIATSIKYHYDHLQIRADRLAYSINKWEPKLKEYIDYDPEVEIKIRPIKGKDVAGRALLEVNKIELDPRYTLRDQCKTIIHELVHNEQVKQSRLEVGADWKWNGALCKEASTYDEYKNLPWEEEARIRTDKIFPDVFGLIN